MKKGLRCFGARDKDRTDWRGFLQSFWPSSEWWRPLARETLSACHFNGSHAFACGGFVYGLSCAKRTVEPRPLRILANSLLSGLVVGAFLAGLVLLGHVVNLRKVFVNAMPSLYQLLTFNQELGTGILILLGAGVLSGVFAGMLYLVPGLARRILIISLSSIVV